MESVRIYEIPKCKMVASQCGMFGDEALEDFDKWLETIPRTMYPQDFLWFDEEQGGFVWYYIYHDGLAIPNSFSIVDFPGGLYAVATGVDGESNEEAMNAIKQFLQNHNCFVIDSSRKELGNIITPPSAQEAMKYSQMDYFVPIKTV
ncbi:hypothetical protein [Breznakia pachnodae]|uniref:AraC family transcriptional regulator n=1 Tax=Breznakia pachnodae TaxID=265178 RepID=A0ABU0E251_9FIRM|nr:hypothetical protein [Breznakia pachnodae]MDQ0360963.1 AraC family transcriptional regulator [Breznakia pachnodae]